MRIRLIRLSSAVLGLVSGILLFFALTTSSSSFKPILTSDVAHLCFDGKLLAAGYGGPLVLSTEPCPGWDQGRPAAVVSAEHPNFVPLGFVLLGLSFVLQIADIASG